MDAPPEGFTLLQSKLDTIRHRAHNDGLPVRRKDGALYRLLADCLSLCEWVQQEGLESQVRDCLRVHVNRRGEDNRGRGRKYVEHASDVYTVVCRYALGDFETRANYTRYAVAIREAAKRQIRGDGLAVFLSDQGGVMALYNARPNPARFMTSRTLHLNSPVTVPKAGPFTLTLSRDYRGFFTVIAAPEITP